MGTRVRWTCAESKAGGFCTASEVARPNSGLGGPLAGGVMSLRLNFGPEVGRKGACARGTFAKSKSGRCCTTSEVAWAHLGLDGPWAGRVILFRLKLGPFLYRLSLRL